MEFVSQGITCAVCGNKREGVNHENEAGEHTGRPDSVIDVPVVLF